MDSKKTYGNKQGKRSNWISLASVISCVAVVTLHTNGCFWSFSMERYWFSANIIECVFYFAVPCFFMITGATLIDYRERYSLAEFFRKRIRKTVIPFFAWSIIAIVWLVLTGSVNVSELSVQAVWNGIVSTSFLQIFWFFPILFGVYLSIPIFAAVSIDNKKEVFLYAAITGFILGGVMPLLSKTIFKGYLWNLSIPVASGFLIYPLIGYLVSSYKISKKIRIAIYISSTIGFLMHLIGTYFLSVKAGEVVTVFKEYINAPCIMYSVGVFTWLRVNGDTIMGNSIINRIVNFIAPYTMSIYLMHWFIYTGIVRCFSINTYSILYRLGAPLIIIPIAIVITWVIRKIPVLKRIVP